MASLLSSLGSSSAMQKKPKLYLSELDRNAFQRRVFPKSETLYMIVMLRFFPGEAPSVGFWRRLRGYALHQEQYRLGSAGWKTAILL